MAMVRPLSFGQLLRRYRTAAGLTQEALAERAGVSARGISDLERGARRAPYHDTIELLANALHLSAPERATFAAAAGRQSPHAATLLPTGLQAMPGGASSPLVGRAAELALLAGHLAGEGSPFLLLAGEPGIGKTRLLRETAARGREGGWTVLEGGCQRRGGQEPYAPLVAALEARLRHRTPAQMRADLDGCPWLARLLPELGETTLTPAPEWALPHEQERRLVFRAVGRFLANVAGPAGTLLILDDLQWAGDDALGLLEALLDPAAEVPLRVVGAARDTEMWSGDALADTLAHLGRDGLARQVALGPLAPHEATALFQRLLGGASDASDALAQRAAERTGGVPFFLMSCAQALRIGAPAAGISEGIEEIPWDAAQSIRQRVAVLPPGAQELLSIAAVIGRQAPYALLLPVTAQAGWSRRDLAAALEAACHARLLLERGTRVYQFTHDLILEVVGAALSAARRASLHHEVAEALRQLPGDPPCEQLAYHYTRSDDKPQALLYLEQAADQAAERYAHAEAESQYRLALELARELSDRRREGAALEKLGTTLILVARYDEAIAALQQAERIARTAGDLEARARALAQVGYAHTRQGTALAGIARLQPYLEPLAAAGLSTLGQATLHFTLGTLLNNASRPAEALESVERALELACSLPRNELMAPAHVVRAIALRALDRLDEALLALAAAESEARAIGDLLTLSRAYMNVMAVHTVRGAFELARECGERACAEVAQCGDPPLASLVYCNCGGTEYLAGEWDRARAFYRQATDAIREVRLSFAAPFPLVGVAQLCLAEGNDDEADRLLSDGVALAESNGNVRVLRHVQVTLAERDLLEGHPETAYERLAPLLDRTPGQEESEVILLLPLLAWAHLDMGREEVAAQVVARSLARASATGQRLVLPDVLRVHALLALRREHWHEAADALNESLAHARAMPYPYAEAKALYVYGQLSAAIGETDQARAQYDAALAICARLGERLYAAHIERARSQ